MPQWQAALPHWTVLEFFEKLEIFLGAEFDFDHRAKVVKMKFSDSACNRPPVKIDNTIDSYESEVSNDDSNTDYLASKVLVPAGDGQCWKYYNCDWIQNNPRLRVMRYQTLDELIDANRLHKSNLTDAMRWGFDYVINHGTQDDPDRENRNTVQDVLYAADVNRYFIMRSVGYMEIDEAIQDFKYIQKYFLQSLNQFGTGTSEDVETESVDFVPVSIDDTYISESEDYYGLMMFLTPGTLDNEEVETDGEHSGVYSANDKKGSYKSKLVECIEEGRDPAKSKEIYSKIYIGYWDGNIYDPDGYPYPYLDSTQVSASWQKFTVPYTLSLNRGEHPYSKLPRIDKSSKSRFSWLSTEIPNPRSIFNIGNGLYVCEKITATFTENGMSQLLKGEFYPIVDSSAD